MSTMELKESSKRFDESMKRAVSRCHELATALKQPLFTQWANSLENIRLQGVHMANAKGRGKMDIEKDLIVVSNKFATEAVNGLSKHD